MPNPPCTNWKAASPSVVIMIRVMSAALQPQILPWTVPAGRAKFTYSAKQTPRLSGAVVSGNLRGSCQGMPTMNGTSNVLVPAVTATRPRIAFPVWKTPAELA